MRRQRHRSRTGAGVCKGEGAAVMVGKRMPLYPNPGGVARLGAPMSPSGIAP